MPLCVIYSMYVVLSLLSIHYHSCHVSGDQGVMSTLPTVPPDISLLTSDFGCEFETGHRDLSWGNPLPSVHTLNS